MKRTIRVLLIEDDPDDVLIVREALHSSEMFHFDLVCADKLTLGLERLEQEQCDVVLLDLSLPDSQGIDTFVELYASRINVPIIVLTGLHDNAMALRMMRLGAQGYLVKGHENLVQLLLTIQYAIEQYFLLKEVTFIHLWEKHEQEMEHFLRWVARDDHFSAVQTRIETLLLSEQRLIQDYQARLTLLLELRGDTITDTADHSIVELTDQLFALNAGACEVVALHLAALKGLCEFASIRQANLYVDAGKLLLAKCLGDLLHRCQTSMPISGGE